MKAVVWHGIGDIRLDDVPKPKIKDDTDAIVRLTASARTGAAGGGAIADAGEDSQTVTDADGGAH